MSQWAPGCRGQRCLAPAAPIVVSPCMQVGTRQRGRKTEGGQTDESAIGWKDKQWDKLTERREKGRNSKADVWTQREKERQRKTQRDRVTERDREKQVKVCRGEEELKERRNERIEERRVEEIKRGEERKERRREGRIEEERRGE